MRPRIELQEKLETLLGTDRVYFDPPKSIRLVYPCMIYTRSQGQTRHANNMPYTFYQGYELTYVDANPDSGMTKTIAMAFPTCYYNRHYTADGLHHDVFTIYY